MLTISYTLPFHASDANVYPLLSPDGASIVVYGHEEGLSLFKIYAQGAEVQPFSSRNDQNVVVDNNKDESSHNRPKLSKWLDIELESPVQHIAFPPISAHSTNNGSHVPDSLASNLTIAASCEDLSIVLISVAFAAEQDKDNDPESRTHVKTTYISRGGGHQEAISAITITWTADSFQQLDKDLGSRSKGRGNGSDDASLTFLVASASTTGSGLLIVCEIPFEAHFANKPDVYTIILRQLVRLPLLGSTLAFNSSVYPSSSHLSLLLTSPAYGIVKIYDLARCGVLLTKRREGSEISTDPDDTLPITSIDTSLTLHAAHTNAAQSRRKAILDASWTSSGQAILALLEDGEWGLWYIHLPDSMMSSSYGGGQLTSLGQLAATSPVKRASKTKMSGSLAPMTPHTRKTRSADLFGQTSHLPSNSLASSIKTGRITLCSSPRWNTAPDDTFVLSYDGIHHYLPSLQALRQSLSEEGRAPRAGIGRLQVLPEVRLGGGQRLGTCTIHGLSGAKSSGFLGTLGQTPNLAVLTDTRLIIFTKPEAQAKGAPSIRNLVFRNIGESKRTISQPSNQTLDVEGIDKILDSMEDDEVSTGFGKGRKPVSSKSSQPLEAGSLADDVPESPSDLAAASSVKLVIDQTGSGSRRNLFTLSK